MMNNINQLLSRIRNYYFTYFCCRLQTLWGSRRSIWSLHFLQSQIWTKIKRGSIHFHFLFPLSFSISKEDQDQERFNSLSLFISTVLCKFKWGPRSREVPFTFTFFFYIPFQFQKKDQDQKSFHSLPLFISTFLFIFKIWTKIKRGFIHFHF